jgi:hypothetical protein
MPFDLFRLGINSITLNLFRQCIVFLDLESVCRKSTKLCLLYIYVRCMNYVGYVASNVRRLLVGEILLRNDYLVVFEGGERKTLRCTLQATCCEDVGGARYYQC